MVNTEELNTEETLKRIIQLHKEAVAGNETAVQDLHMILEQLRDNYSDNPLLKAYHAIQ
ncbi:hypothetical protein JCM21714_3041 [Gracilibacillus boraciitolerans JCM 21714]|uniref:Uncharacterized protein n=1 Tax=Gracilibacillus boraciitolerans JCM 21714 TaxID=1298598 RepID=W4VLB0_9BACI|nr:hypothetical protein [Gracilibacillus boraciitolerans]GAE93921.1 hypothetical protein JCM21714_3041 [Gracilibacillus boraciitolerans JCM 21714]